MKKIGKHKYKNWQYKSSYIQVRPPDIFVGTTERGMQNPNDYGDDGWELVQIVDNPRLSEPLHDAKIAYFKRPLPPLTEFQKEMRKRPSEEMGED